MKLHFVKYCIQGNILPCFIFALSPSLQIINTTASGRTQDGAKRLASVKITWVENNPVYSILPLISLYTNSLI